MIFHFNHDWQFWHTDKGKQGEKVFRRCKKCGKTQEEVWTGFAEYYWCPIGYTKEDVLNTLA